MIKEADDGKIAIEICLHTVGWKQILIFFIELKHNILKAELP